MKRLEALRRIWTPDREIYELTANLDPGSELDSLVRDFFSRMVYERRSITLDLTEPTHGTINWEIVSVPVRPGEFRKEVTIWWEADERTMLSEQV